jgi:hypothetical protein
LEDRVRRPALAPLLVRLVVLRERALVLRGREPELLDPDARERDSEERRALDPVDPFLDTPEAAPRTMPRAAPNTISPAFIAPASP